MKRKFHVRFLGEGAAVMPPPYPASGEILSNIVIHPAIKRAIVVMEIWIIVTAMAVRITG